MLYKHLGRSRWGKWECWQSECLQVCVIQHANAITPLLHGHLLNEIGLLWSIISKKKIPSKWPLPHTHTQVLPMNLICCLRLPFNMVQATAVDAMRTIPTRKGFRASVYLPGEFCKKRFHKNSNLPKTLFKGDVYKVLDQHFQYITFTLPKTCNGNPTFVSYLPNSPQPGR